VFKLVERVASAQPFLHVVNNRSTEGDRFFGSGFLTSLQYSGIILTVTVLRDRSIDPPSPPVTKFSRLVDPIPPRRSRSKWVPPYRKMYCLQKSYEYKEAHL